MKSEEATEFVIFNNQKAKRTYARVKTVDAVKTDVNSPGTG